MIAGVFEMRRSVAVVVVACLLIVGGVTGAALSSWAKHNPVARSLHIHCRGRKKCGSGAAQCDGIRARVEARAGRRCKYFVFAYRENAAGAFQPLL